MTAQIPRSIAVTAHPHLPDAIQDARKITEFLRDHDVQSVWGFLDNESLRQQVRSGEFELVIALGGDGTMLRVGHLCAPLGIPILGINHGRFGFLLEIQHDEWMERLTALLRGEYRLEQRMMITAEQWRKDECLQSWDVLNEVVVSRGRLIRPIQLSAFVDGRFLATYVADALIASTPTGSTAYALAAGGPILPPELRNILLVPVAPHLSIDRAIMLAEGSTVSITVETDHEAVISIDGQYPVVLSEDEHVDAHASEHTIKFVRFQDPGYFYRNLTPHMSQNPSTGNRR
jgi:NAD+ kinase